MTGLVLLILLGVEVPEWAVTSNRGPNCLWACVHVMGRMHNIDEVKEILLDRRLIDHTKGFEWATDDTVLEYLNKIKATHKHKKHYSRDTSLLEEYANSHGVVVSFAPGFRKGWAWHAVLVTKYTKTEVAYWDPNFPQQRFKATRQWFDYWWTGGSLVVLPRE